MRARVRVRVRARVEGEGGGAGEGAGAGAGYLLADGDVDARDAVAIPLALRRVLSLERALAHLVRVGFGLGFGWLAGGVNRTGGRGRAGETASNGGRDDLVVADVVGALHVLPEPVLVEEGHRRVQLGHDRL